jgi:myosin heavy subunit
VNPYAWIPWYYSKEMMAYYTIPREEGEPAPPHIYDIAFRAYNDMASHGKDQSIIISGESGAGKTEATKQCMVLFAAVNTSNRRAGNGQGGGGGGGDGHVDIEQRILSANPVLEAFGNACTVRNNNSSRFGKWMEIHFRAAAPIPSAAAARRSSFSLAPPATTGAGAGAGAGTGGGGGGGGSSPTFRICGCKTVNYLLEKSRVVGQAPFERNYHVLYHLCAAAGDDAILRDRLRLPPAPALRFLRCDSDDDADIAATAAAAAAAAAASRSHPQQQFEHRGRSQRDAGSAEAFLDLQQRFAALGFEHDEVSQVWDALAVVLHLGDVRFAACERDGSDCCEVVEGGAGAEAGGRRAVRECERLAGLLPGGGRAVDGEDTYDSDEPEGGADGDSPLAEALCWRIVTARGDTLRMPHTTEQAEEATRALAKTAYSLLFDWLVQRVNALTEQALQAEQSAAAAAAATTASGSGSPDHGSRSRRPPATSPHLLKTQSAPAASQSGGCGGGGGYGGSGGYGAGGGADGSEAKRTIGVLDIFGFEIFESNSFEQLCINYCNEKLQQHFNTHTFKTEEELYVVEMVAYTPTNFIDNQDVLDLFERRPNGLLPLLDDHCRMPKGSDESYANKAMQLHDSSLPRSFEAGNRGAGPSRFSVDRR